MHFRSVVAAGALLLSSLVCPVWAQGAAADGSPVIDIAGHKVPVVRGGLYDRFRSNPPLSVIAAEAPEIDLSWFKTLKKTKLDIGFESHSPNFYYKNSRVTAVYTADIDRLRELIPPKVLAEVQPLQVWPGRGLIAITAYSYEYCDNDGYNEVAISIVTSKLGGSNWGAFSLLAQSMDKDLSGYVLKLPVNTEVARVRGVVGYNLPKWLIPINLKDGEKSVSYEIFDAQTGKPDLVIEARKLDGLSNKEEFVTNRFTNLDQQGNLTKGHSVSRQLSHASSMDQDAVKLTLHDGSLSGFIKTLKLGRMVKYEYVPQFQGALYAPERVEAASDR
ncbi:acetoacetate decarboxylase (ADC) [Aquabacterium sp. UBA2148]|uniref:acetoacetate decarboxylase (ADC) n=1 Tax=Aquabacterium sp. UBA2148 TaxID=1946042 RepID=UPI00257F21BC|nr:acetoacetate decarboxylase (ADC) [Aquabacterium sp. UBA2148]